MKIVRKNARKIATPPARGMGCVCTFLAEGISSSSRYFLAILQTIGVRIKENTNDNEKTAIIVVTVSGVPSY